LRAENIVLEVASQAVGWGDGQQARTPPHANP
jgi:hypothetical protein